MSRKRSTDAETRKLQKVGGGTYTVSLPKEWATERSLSAGDAVRVFPDGDGSLVICRDAEDPAAATVSRAVVAAFDRVVSAAYAAGVERLVLTAEEGFSSGERRRIERLVRDRTGMCVAEATDSAVEVKTLLDDDQVSLERTVVQLQFVALSLLRTAVDGVVDAATVDPERVADRRAEARRLLDLVTRQFGRSLSRPGTAGALAMDRSTAFALYRAAEELEGVASAAADVAEAAAACDGTPVSGTAVRPVADAIRVFLEDATSAVVDGADLAAVRDLYRTADDVAATVDELDESHGGDCAHAVRAALRTCSAAGEGIVDVAAERALQRVDRRDG